MSAMNGRRDAFLHSQVPAYLTIITFTQLCEEYVAIDGFRNVTDAFLAAIERPW
jgi:hypothetical protein